MGGGGGAEKFSEVLPVLARVQDDLGSSCIFNCQIYIHPPTFVVLFLIF